MKINYLFKNAIGQIYHQKECFEKWGASLIHPSAKRELENFPVLYRDLRSISESNPCSSFLRIELEPVSGSTSKLTVLNDQGQVIKQNTTPARNNIHMSLMIVRCIASDGNKAEFIIKKEFR